jgi:hypothetical protein
MKSPQTQFEYILQNLESNYTDVSAGPMMSSPGIKYKGKVFAFYHEEAMTFKLGKSFVPEDYGITDWDWLSPFTNKPPMKAWFIISAQHRQQWEELAAYALEQMKRA